MTYQEKALTKIAKTIKQLDSFAIEAAMLKEAYSSYRGARLLLFNILEENGYNLTTKYKLVKIRKDERDRHEKSDIFADQIGRL